MRLVVPVLSVMLGLSVACGVRSEDTSASDGESSAAATEAAPAACTTWKLPSSGRDPYAGRPSDPFDPASCSSWPTSRSAIVEMLGPAKAPVRFCGSTKVFTRQRKCTPSGCEKWGAAKELAATIGSENGDVSRPIVVHLGLMTKGQSSVGDALKFVVEEDSMPARSPSTLVGVTYDYDRRQIDDAKLPYVFEGSLLDVSVGNIVTTNLTVSDDCARFTGSETILDWSDRNARIEIDYAAVFRF